MLMGIFTIIPAVILSAKIEWWIPVVILSTMMPLVYIRSKIQRKSWNIRETYAPTFKQLEVYEEILTLPSYAQDLRLYAMASRLLQRWEHLFQRFFRAIQRVRYQGGWIISAFALVSTVGMGIYFWYVARGALSGIFTVGQLSFVFGVVIQLRSGISGLIYNIGDTVKAFLSLKCQNRSSFPRFCAFPLVGPRECGCPTNPTFR